MPNPLTNLTHMVSSAAGIGTLSAMQKASSPKGILQYIINVLTLGGIRRDNEKEYQVFVQSMADELSKTGYYRSGKFPEKIIMDNFNGYKVDFSIPAPNTSSERVIIEVSKNNLSESTEIPFGTFEKICNALVFRREFSIPQHGIILTENGGMYLKDANFEGANLAGEDLSYADLSNSRMDENSNLFMTDFSYANLKGCCLFGVHMNNTNLSGACLENVVIYGGIMDNVNAVESNFKYARLTGCSIIECNLTQADMKSAVLSGCDISNSNLECCDLSGANMLAAHLNSNNFTRGNLKETNLKYSTLTNLNLTEADLTKIQMNNCTFSNLYLEGALMSKYYKLLLNDFCVEYYDVPAPPG